VSGEIGMTELADGDKVIAVITNFVHDVFENNNIVSVDIILIS